MYIRVHVVPGARKEKVIKEKEAVYTILVKEPAERNMANKRILEILAEMKAVDKSKVSLLTGHRSSSKMYSIDNY